MRTIRLKWTRYQKMTDARVAFSHTPCVYIQADGAGRPVRVGKASRGLEPRYRGGTGYALDAAAHSSGNLVFVAPVSKKSCDIVERSLIWQYRGVLTYNNIGKKTPPNMPVGLLHAGQLPGFPRTSKLVAR